MLASAMILAVTGHRPDKLGGYAPDIANRLRLLAHKYLVEQKPNFVISGMALGWDQAVAGAALLAGIPLVAAVPFAGQESKWPPRARQIYRELLDAAYRVEYVSPFGYAAWKMQKRNEWMVDHANRMLALWDGTPGGTANCLAFAARNRLPVDNLWEQFANERLVPHYASQ